MIMKLSKNTKVLHFYFTGGRYDLRKSESRRNELKNQRIPQNTQKLLNYSTIAEYKFYREQKAEEAIDKCLNNIFRNCK